MVARQLRPQEAVSAPPRTEPSLAVLTEPAASVPGKCAYTWAYQDLPELSEQVQAAIRELRPQAEAHASAFGEDCKHADGRVNFLAMETDFYVTLPVSEVDDTAELGGWARRTLDLLLERFPTGETPGPQPGRVTLRFVSEGEERNLVVPVSEYLALPGDLSDAALFEALSHAP